MNYPIQMNKVEILTTDPKEKREGLIWFNKSEGVIKFYDNEGVSVILTDKKFKDTISDLVDEKLNKTFFKFKFDNSKLIKIKHNFNTKLFYVSVFDENENSIISVSAETIDENNIQIEFLENISGYVLINFYKN